jgi:hypothetical protein
MECFNGLLENKKEEKEGKENEKRRKIENVYCLVILLSTYEH